MDRARGSAPRHGVSRRLRYWLEWALLRSGVALVRLMPPTMAARVIGKGWRWVAPFNRRHQRALENIRHAFPDMPPEQREALARDAWENLGQVMAETLQLDRLVADPSRFEFDVDGVREAVGDGGAVIVSMHAGNWEVTALGGHAAGWQTAGVYQALKNPLTETLLHDLRAPVYPAGLFAKGHDTARRLLGLARSGGRVAMLADLRDLRGVVVPFFGRDAYATPYPATIALAAKVPLIACRVIRLPGSRFRIEAEVVPMPQSGDRKADALEATRRYHARFETWIREYPEQWMWIMRKWIDGPSR
ncbi:lysophospholipid acyltransferase family protein [Stappia indica]|uniref:lysophospholipid acyltransferase family protein n=1 Tax=Stappia indica TaxID=538381 RepID=UPI001CD6CE0C|nr:lauroyl acyltransferase [Stappia indica]MCA1296996.1 lauroyl acyltransferase [Stappia indica]